MRKNRNETPLHVVKQTNSIAADEENWPEVWPITNQVNWGGKLKYRQLKAQ